VGQKIHPIGFRVGVIRDWESKWFAEKNYADLLIEDLEIRKNIKKALPNAAISTIEVERLANRVKVTLHSGRPGVIIGKGRRGVDELEKKLEAKFKKDITIEIREIRHPELDAQLVAESIAQQIEKRIAYKRAMRQAMMRAMRAGSQGIKLQCKGRLAGAEMARVEIMKDGKVPLHTIRADIDYGLAEAATQYGNIGVKIWICRGEILGNQRHALPDRDSRPVRPEGPVRQAGGRGEGGRGRGRGEGGGRGGRGRGEGGGRGPGGGGGGRPGGGGRGPGGGGGRPGGGGRGPGGGGGRPGGTGGRPPRTDGGSA
jgi:small subunit ribosomal protein S3